MDTEQIIKAAIPHATDRLMDYIVWGRTPFPCGPVSAKQLYKAASGYQRATANNIILCEFCDNKAPTGKYACDRCESVLSKAINRQRVNEN